MTPLIRLAAKEVVTTAALNLVWRGYKEYCKWCWKKLYKRDK